MSIKILIDMNLSPDWVPLLQSAGWSADHWSTVGVPRAADREIMDWAEANGYMEGTSPAIFVLLAVLVARGYARSRPPGYQIALRDRVLVALTVFAVGGLAIGAAVVFGFKFAPEVTNSSSGSFSKPAQRPGVADVLARCDFGVG